MAAYAEGLSILRKLTSASKQTSQSTPKLRHCADPKQYERDMSLQDKAEVWPRSSVIASWLLDLTAAALVQDPNLSRFAGRVL